MLDHMCLVDHATFRTEEFHHLLDIYERQLAMRGDEVSVPSFRGEAAFLAQSMGQSGSYDFEDDNHSIVLQPVMDQENPQYLGLASVACIPRKAAHPKLALIYCEGMLAPELNRYYGDLSHFFFNTMPACYVEAAYPQTTLNGGDTIIVSADMLKLDIWGYYEIPITQEEFDMYKFCREHVLFRSLLWRKLNREWEAYLTGYLDGSLSFDQMTKRLDMALDMMLNE